MANMLINVLCFAVTQGLNGALETLVSQAFGSNHFKQCGLLLNRGRIITTLVFLPVALIL